MATGWSSSLSRHDVLLPIISTDFRSGDDRPPFVLIDDEGTVRPATFTTVRPTVDVVTGSCTGAGRRLADNADLYFPAAAMEPLFLRLDYRATEDVELKVSTAWEKIWTPGRWPVALPGGAHTRLVPLAAERMHGVDLQLVTPGAGFCVQRASVVRAVLLDPGGPGCRAIDWFGSPRQPVACS
jgi:hypothetical protein